MSKTKFQSTFEKFMVDNNVSSVSQALNLATNDIRVAQNLVNELAKKGIVSKSIAESAIADISEDIRTIQTNNSTCPPLAVCADLTLKSIFCGNGMENDITIATGEKCPVRFPTIKGYGVVPSILEGGMVADYSANFQYPNSDCTTVTPKLFSVLYTITEQRLNCQGCSNFVSEMVEHQSFTLTNTVRNQIYNSMVALGTDYTAGYTGSADILSKLEYVIKKTRANKAGGNLVFYVSPSIFDQIINAKDTQGRYQFSNIVYGQCEGRDCRVVCINGVTVKEWLDMPTFLVGTVQGSYIIGGRMKAVVAGMSAVQTRDNINNNARDLTLTNSQMRADMYFDCTIPTSFANQLSRILVVE